MFKPTLSNITTDDVYFNDFSMKIDMALIKNLINFVFVTIFVWLRCSKVCV